MKKIVVGFLIGVILFFDASAQKKPLDHTVYDSWQRIGERLISPDGNWAVFVIELQEGDPTLIIRSLLDKKEIAYPRGTSPQLSFNGRFLIFKIRPTYAALREARIRKKKPEDLPKDSLCIA